MKQKPKKYGIAYGSQKPRKADGVFESIKDAKTELAKHLESGKTAINAYAGFFDWNSYFGGKPHIVEM